MNWFDQQQFFLVIFIKKMRKLMSHFIMLFEVFCISLAIRWNSGTGILGTVASLIVSAITGLPVAMALSCFVGLSVCVAMADVTIDACIATNSINKPKLAPDMQSLCGFLSSLGALIGYSSSGFLVHHLGPQVGFNMLLVLLFFFYFL
jgi:BT1 family